MSISLVIIDYYSAGRTLRFVRDFTAYCGLIECHFIIIDNSCDEHNYYALTDGEEENVKINNFGECYINNNVVVYRSRNNGGFAKGNNTGFLLSQHLFSDPYILFSNNDILFDERFKLDELIRCFEYDSSVSVVGPVVIGLDGKMQSPYKYQNIYQRWCWKLFFWPFDKLLRPGKKNEGDIIEVSGSCFVYRIIGAFMLCKSVDLSECGAFDENTFLYAEEMILSERMSNIGKKFYYFNGCTVIHEGGLTTKKASNDVERLREKFKSEIYYYTKYKDASKFSTIIARLCLEIFILKKSICKHIWRNR